MTSGGGGAVTREREATRSELRRLEFLRCAPGAQENQSPPSPARRPPAEPEKRDRGWHGNGGRFTPRL